MIKKRNVESWIICDLCALYANLRHLIRNKVNQTIVSCVCVQLFRQYFFCEIIDMSCSKFSFILIQCVKCLLSHKHICRLLINCVYLLWSFIEFDLCRFMHCLISPKKKSRLFSQREIKSTKHIQMMFVTWEVDEVMSR